MKNVLSNLFHLLGIILILLLLWIILEVTGFLPAMWHSITIMQQAGH